MPILPIADPSRFPASSRFPAFRFHILAELAKGDRAGVDVLKKWTGDGNPDRTFWDARKELIDEGKLVVDDSRKPKMWHLVAEDEREWLNPGWPAKRSLRSAENA